MLKEVPGKTSEWEVAAVALGTRSGPLRRKRTVRVVDWAEVKSLFDTTPVAAEVAALRDMHPSDVAAAVRALPAHHRRQLAEVMDDERLADLLEELPEAEQLRLIEGLDLERLVAVLEEMETDDAADLLDEMPGEERTRVLDAMEPEDADELRRLLSYGEETAGGLMNTDPVVLGPHATVAEALARIRDPELAGRARRAGLRDAAPVGHTDRHLPRRRPLPTPAARAARHGAGQVHRRRAARRRRPPRAPRSRSASPSYNLVSVAVCDAERQLLGTVTVDDVLDRSLPAGWRQRIRETAG